MKLLTRLGLFSAIALAPVLMDDIHDYFESAATNKVVMASHHQIASIQGR
ncbi:MULTISPECIES: hypothetical protein [Rhodospirillales]|uniref:Uncharacterized protein n=1 Tax=Paramagnetospirillum caucaseum TaxID=1244869 RepID=M2ZKR3_9PROT|nr:MULTISPECIES: hypothetical protein [Rhodospirillales]EME67892.1 hypothetical protein H261_21271 [Paramagnetospirillum caucaseum]